MDEGYERVCSQLLTIDARRQSELIFKSAVRLRYFVRWLRLKSLDDLEKARSATPITRHNATTPNTIDIGRKPPVFMN
jgi:hypothetical protein